MLLRPKFGDGILLNTPAGTGRGLSGNVKIAKEL
jgi:hypothetical protein